MRITITIDTDSSEVKVESPPVLEPVPVPEPVPEPVPDSTPIGRLDPPKSSRVVECKNLDKMIDEIVMNSFSGSQGSKKRCIEQIFMDHGLIPDTRKPEDDFTPIDENILGTDIDLLAQPEGSMEDFVAMKREHEKYMKGQKERFLAAARKDILTTLERLDAINPTSGDEYLEGMMKSSSKPIYVQAATVIHKERALIKYAAPIEELKAEEP